MEEQVNTADSDIKVQEKRRVDLVYNLADCVKQYDKHEAETLTAIVEGRGKTTNLENVTTAITAVTEAYPEINGEYMYIEKIEEHYNMHTRTVTTTDSKGKTHTKTETYWSWDYAGSEEQRCSEITFLGHIFPSNKVEFPSTEHIDTIKESSHVRHKYYGVDTEYIGTIFTELRDKTISDNSSFYENSTIEETVDYLESDWELWLFWVIWIIVIGLCVFGFYYIDNEWIEN